MNRTATILLTLLISAVFLAPIGASQIPNSNYVAKCSKECYPQDADVNGPAIKKGDATVRTILYGHFEDILNRAPLNTQIPDVNKEPDLNRGYLMPVLKTNTGVGDADFRFENNNFIMYSSAGLVEIFDGVWRTHQEPGLAEDVNVASEEIILYWYMSAHPVPNGNSREGGGQQANLDVVPQVGVYARMETGRTPYSTRSTLIAEGDTGKGGVNDIAGGDGRVNMVSRPGEDPVYEFRVPMKVTPLGKTLPSVASQAGFVVSVHPYQIRDPEAGNEVMQADWRVRSGYTFPPRIVLDVANSMETTAASLSLFDSNMFVRWSFVSPWGSYDTEDKSVTITLAGPQQVDPKLVNLVILKRSVDHDGHFKPINATWKFDYKKAGLADGEYTFKLSITNLQKTYVLEQDLPFEVVDGRPEVKLIGSAGGKTDGGKAQSIDGGEGLPGFESVLLLTSLLLVVFVSRRRRD